MTHLDLIVAVIKLGQLFILSYRAIAILIWVRMIYIYILTDPNGNYLIDLWELYAEETGRELLIDPPDEYEGLPDIAWYREYEDFFDDKWLVPNLD